MVDGDCLSTSGENSLLGAACKSQSSNGHIENVVEPNIVGDGSDLDNDLAFKVGVCGSFLGDA